MEKLCGVSCRSGVAASPDISPVLPLVTAVRGEIKQIILAATIVFCFEASSSTYAREVPKTTMATYHTDLRCLIERVLDVWCIKNTLGWLKELELFVRAKVMLPYNVDVSTKGLCRHRLYYKYYIAI